jgi:Spy/CpxP family protein refolding chaperone
MAGKPVYRRWLMSGSLALVLFASPALLHANQDASKSDSKSKPTLAGPKVDHDAQGKGKQFNGQNRSRGDVLQEALKTVNLTDDQKKQIQTIIVEHRASRTQWQKANHENLQKLQLELKAAQEAKNSEQAQDLQKQIKTIRDTAPQANQTTPLIRKVLTDEQREALDARIKEIQDSRRAARNRENSMMMGGKADRKKPASEKNNKGKDRKLDL